MSPSSVHPSTRMENVSPPSPPSRPPSAPSSLASRFSHSSLSVRSRPSPSSQPTQAQLELAALLASDVDELERPPRIDDAASSTTSAFRRWSVSSSNLAVPSALAQNNRDGAPRSSTLSPPPAPSSLLGKADMTGPPSLPLFPLPSPRFLAGGGIAVGDFTSSTAASRAVLTGPDRGTVLHEVKRLREAKAKERKAKWRVGAGCMCLLVGAVSVYFAVRYFIAFIFLRPRSSSSSPTGVALPCPDPLLQVVSVSAGILEVVSATCAFVVGAYLRLTRRPRRWFRIPVLFLAYLSAVVTVVLAVTNLAMILLWHKQYSSNSTSSTSSSSSLFALTRSPDLRCGAWDLDLTWGAGSHYIDAVQRGGSACSSSMEEQQSFRMFLTAGAVRLIFCLSAWGLHLFLLHRYNRVLSIASIVDPTSTPSTSAEIRAILDRYRKNGVPLDARLAEERKGLGPEYAYEAGEFGEQITLLREEAEESHRRRHPSAYEDNEEAQTLDAPTTAPSAEEAPATAGWLSWLFGGLSSVITSSPSPSTDEQGVRADDSSRRGLLSADVEDPDAGEEDDAVFAAFSKVEDHRERHSMPSPPFPQPSTLSSFSYSSHQSMPTPSSTMISAPASERLPVSLSRRPAGGRSSYHQRTAIRRVSAGAAEGDKFTAFSSRSSAPVAVHQHASVRSARRRSAPPAISRVRPVTTATTTVVGNAVPNSTSLGSLSSARNWPGAPKLERLHFQQASVGATLASSTGEHGLTPRADWDVAGLSAYDTYGEEDHRSRRGDGLVSAFSGMLDRIFGSSISTAEGTSLTSASAGPPGHAVRVSSDIEKEPGHPPPGPSKTTAPTSMRGRSPTRREDAPEQNDGHGRTASQESRARASRHAASAAAAATFRPPSSSLPPSLLPAAPAIEWTPGPDRSLPPPPRKRTSSASRSRSSSRGRSPSASPIIKQNPPIPATSSSLGATNALTTQTQPSQRIGDNLPHHPSSSSSPSMAPREQKQQLFIKLGHHLGHVELLSTIESIGSAEERSRSRSANLSGASGLSGRLGSSALGHESGKLSGETLMEVKEDENREPLHDDGVPLWERIPPPSDVALVQPASSESHLHTSSDRSTSMVGGRGGERHERTSREQQSRREALTLTAVDARKGSERCSSVSLHEDEGYAGIVAAIAPEEHERDEGTRKGHRALPGGWAGSW